MNGTTDHPSYAQVCGGSTGHAEAVKVVFDPTKTSFKQLMLRFFELCDPWGRPGESVDHGSQYRTAIFTANGEQLAQARALVAELAAQPQHAGQRFLTLIEPAQTFWRAEEYHQDYYKK